MSRVRLLVMLVFTTLLLAAPLAHAGASNVAVSQLFAGGGNTGATYQNDFVELLNRGSSAVDVSGWTLQSASATGTTWSTTPLSGSIQPGHYYLVQLASSGAIGAVLPTADATGTPNLAMSGGKVALVRGNTALTCGASAGSCSAAPLVEDLVGYGSATDYEGSGPAPVLTSTTAAIRAATGCTDADSNATDFSTALPAARNSSSPAASCGASSNAGVSSDASVGVNVQPVLSIALERSSVDFGNALAGTTPAPISEHVTVVSNDAAGYSLSVHRSAFSPADLPLALSASAPAGGALGSSLIGGPLVGIPIAPASDLLIGTTAAASAASGDTWGSSLGFSAPLPIVPAGHYSATVTFTAIGR